jgi:hypothetical protein
VDINEYRAGAEDFVSSLDKEYYLHYAGIKDAFEIEAVYDRHAALFTREAVERVREAYAQAPAGSDRQRQRRMLLNFAVEGFLGAETKQLEAHQAEREASLTLEVSGREIGFREVDIVEANEPDPTARRAIDAQRLALVVQELNPLAAEILERQHAGAVELGFASYTAMCSELQGCDLKGLHTATERFLTDSQARFAEVVSPEVETSLGFGLADMHQSDFGRFLRTPDLDTSFPAERLLDSLYETVGGLGIDLRTQANVHLDVEARPNKSPRAFCAPVRAPQEVYLVIAPTGGRSDYTALFHEAGHTEHFAHMDVTLPFEFRYFGDNAVTEGFAFLFEHLEQNPLWLARRVGALEPEAVVRRSIAERVLMIRRYATKLTYELELHSGDPTVDLPSRYAALATQGVGFEVTAERYLTDVDPGFYCSAYLRAWALETHLRGELIDRYGDTWFEQPAAGATLREWWSQGQRLSAEEFLAELTGATLDFGVLLEDLALT